MAKHGPSEEKKVDVRPEDARSFLFGPPVSYDLLRVWIADRYQVDQNEIAYELGLDPEPNWFGSDEGDLDFDREKNAEKRDRWREWKMEYDGMVKSDPERYRRIIAKVSLRYADEFLRLAGIKRPGAPEELPEADDEVGDESIETPAFGCICGKVCPTENVVRYRDSNYCSWSCPALPESVRRP